MTANKQVAKVIACAAAALVAFTLGSSLGVAQAGKASTEDKQFLKDLAEDSNFEIATAQLALQKSPSADVKAYAHMLITDHTRLKQQVATADRVTGIAPAGADSMSVADHTRLEELKLLSGKTFDDTYIKGLVKGNDEIQKEEKSEASSSSVPQIKTLAERSAAVDTKHADKAKQLAQAHNIQS